MRHKCQLIRTSGSTILVFDDRKPKVAFSCRRVSGIPPFCIPLGFVLQRMWTIKWWPCTGQGMFYGYGKMLPQLTADVSNWECVILFGSVCDTDLRQPHVLIWPTKMDVIHADPTIMKMLRVDRGAIKFVLAGANIMCPGLTSAGGALDDDVPAEAPVVRATFPLLRLYCSWVNLAACSVIGVVNSVGRQEFRRDFGNLRLTLSHFPTGHHGGGQGTCSCNRLHQDVSKRHVRHFFSKFPTEVLWLLKIVNFLLFYQLKQNAVTDGNSFFFAFLSI